MTTHFLIDPYSVWLVPDCLLLKLIRFEPPPHWPLLFWLKGSIYFQKKLQFFHNQRYEGGNAEFILNGQANKVTTQRAQSLIIQAALLYLYTLENEFQEIWLILNITWIHPARFNYKGRRRRDKISHTEATTMVMHGKIQITFKKLILGNVWLTG